MRRGLLVGVLALAVGLPAAGAAAGQCQWGGVDLEGRPIPADSWLCSDRVVHGTPPTPAPTATPTPTPLPSPTPTPTATPTATPSLAATRVACREAIAMVQDFAVDRGGLIRLAVANGLAAARSAGARIEVDGWSASGPPPPCQVQFNYRENGQTVRLRWLVDPITGDVTALDPLTARMSGF
jgi:hypothetical protein